MWVINVARKFPISTFLVLTLTTVLIAYFLGFKWLTAFWSLVGVYINIHKLKFCFVIWAITNFTWAVVDFKHNLPEQGTLFSVYFVLAIYGLIQWHKEGKI
jgi:hypothetical protein